MIEGDQGPRFWGGRSGQLRLCRARPAFPGSAGLPGSPKPANRSTAEGVEFRLSFAFRFFPMLTWRRLRFFSVWRVFDAMAGAF